MIKFFCSPIKILNNKLSVFRLLDNYFLHNILLEESLELIKFKERDCVKNLSNNSVCIDCGAHVGNVTNIFQEKGATVYAFEPNPDIFRILKTRFYYNSKVICIRKGVWDKNIKTKLFKHGLQKDDLKSVDYTQSSSIFSSKKNISTDNYCKIKIIDLTEFINEISTRVNILKIDVEGAEYDILKKIIDMDLYKKIDSILVEVHEDRVPEIQRQAIVVRELIDIKKIKNIDLNWH